MGGCTERCSPSQKVFSVYLDDLISEAVSQPASASAPPTLSLWQSLSDTPLGESTGLALSGGLLAVGGGSLTTWNSPIYHYQPIAAGGGSRLGLVDNIVSYICAILSSGDLFVAGGDAGQRVDIVSVQ
jgi:hypothetical protein